MKTRLTVTYKNGNQITDFVNYLHFEDGKLFYTVDKQVITRALEPVAIQLKNIEKFDLEKWEGAE